MRHLIALLFGVVLLAGCGASEPPTATGGATWSTDWEASLKAAKDGGKLMIVNFSGSNWCGWCIKLDQQVLSQPAFATWAKDRFILVNLDFPRPSSQPEEIQKRNRELLGKYGVQGFPTVLFIDGEGKAVATTGYVEGGPEAWTKQADALLKEAGH